MKFVIESDLYTPCEAVEFMINGIQADKKDFVKRIDRKQNLVGIGGCVDHKVPCCGDSYEEVINSSKEVLDKYSITELEFIVIAKAVSKELSVGMCNLCG